MTSIDQANVCDNIRIHIEMCYEYKCTLDLIRLLTSKPLRSTNTGFINGCHYSSIVEGRWGVTFPIVLSPHPPVLKSPYICIFHPYYF